MGSFTLAFIIRYNGGAALFTACEKDDFNPAATNAVELAGDWYVQTFVGGQVALDYRRTGFLEDEH